MTETVFLSNTITTIDRPNDDLILKSEELITTHQSINAKSIVCDGVKTKSCQLVFKAQEDIMITNLETSGSLARVQPDKKQMNASISINNNGNLIIKDCKINQFAGHNGIEIGLNLGYAPKSVVIENVDFSNKVTNVAVLVFATKNNATVSIDKCHFKSVTNFFRLSNRDNVNCTVNINDCVVEEWGTNKSWPGGIIFEDYISKTLDEVLVSNRYAPEKIVFNIKDLIGPNKKVVNPKDLNTVASTFDNKQIFYICNDKEITYTVENGIIKITNPLKYNENKHRYPTFNFIDTISRKVPAVIYPEINTNLWSPDTGYKHQEIAKTIEKAFSGLAVTGVVLDISTPAKAEKIIKEYGVFKYLAHLPPELLMEKLIK